jgi:hypothetical protein
VDSLSCEFYGDTVWDRCWWFNNSWFLGFGVSGAAYVWGWRMILRRDSEDKSRNSLLGPAYFFLGTAIVFFGGGIAVSMLFENLFGNA